MKKSTTILLCLLCVVFTSCGNHKTADEGEEGLEESKVEQVFPPIGLYFGTPTSMFGSTNNYEIEPSNLPDFVTYKNDADRMGLRGRVKEVKDMVSTFSWTYKFNSEGNLMDYQFRMDSRGSYGEGAKAEYNEAGELVLLGRNFRGQSPNSHKYEYSKGKLVKRSSNRGERIYYYHDSKGVAVPDSSVTKGLTPYLNIKYVQRDGITLIDNMVYENPSLPGGLRADKAQSFFNYADDGQLNSLTTTYQGVKGYSSKVLYGLIEYTYNDEGDVEKMDIYLFTDKAPLTDTSLHGQAVHHSVVTYEYRYDEYGNWTYMCMNEEPKPKNTISLNTVSRTIIYYSEDEIKDIADAQKEVDEKPFVGIWSYEEKEDMGDGDTYVYSGTLVLNLYDKFIPDGGNNPQSGVMVAYEQTPFGQTHVSMFNVSSFVIKGNDIKLTVVDDNSGAKYSALLKYNSRNRSMSISDVKEIEAGEEEMGVVSVYPFEGTYNFVQRSTTMSK